MSALLIKNLNMYLTRHPFTIFRKYLPLYLFTNLINARLYNYSPFYYINNLPVVTTN